MNNARNSVGVMASALAGGCATRLTDFTVISTKSLSMPLNKGPRVTGEDCGFSVELKEAIDTAIESGGSEGDMLVDGVVTLKQYPFWTCYVVEGTIASGSASSSTSAVDDASAIASAAKPRSETARKAHKQGVSTMISGETPMFKSIAFSSLLFAMLAACGGGGSKGSTNTGGANSASGGTGGSQPATGGKTGMTDVSTMTPSGKTTATSMQPRTRMPTAPPQGMSVMPTMTIPSTSDAKELSAVAMMSIDESAELAAGCAALGIDEGEGFCADDDYLVFCAANEAYALDCDLFTNADSSPQTVGFCDDEDDEAGCVVLDVGTVDPDIVDNVESAFDTEEPCEDGEEGIATCVGDLIFFCNQNSWVALDCTLFDDAATCGSVDGEIMSCVL